MSNSFSVALLSNVSAAGNGAAFGWTGGSGVATFDGTFGGTSATLQYLGPSGTWLDVKALDPSTGTQTTVALTAAGMIGFLLPPGQIRAVLTGGAPANVYAIAATTTL